MALTYGFYNSQNGDRVYDADQFSSFLDGIVYDGVYEAVGDKFYVTSLEDEDLTIQVGAGRAWLKHTWTLNDTNLYLNATAALDVYDRIDAVVLEVDKEIRTNSIKIIEGTPSDATPARPDLKNEDNIRQYPLAYIYREHGTTKIPNTHAGTLETDTESATECIKFMVGSSSMPLCSALALAGIPSGGKIGQVLAKNSSESGSVDWYDWYKLPNDHPWYLLDGMTENNVVVAYKFIKQDTITDALKNENSNGSYPLTITGNVTWTLSKGLYFPAVKNCYINNTELLAKKENAVTCVFRYSDRMVSSGRTAGFCFDISAGTPNYAAYLVFNSAQAITCAKESWGYRYTTGLNNNDGVIAVDGAASAKVIYSDGVAKSMNTYHPEEGVWLGNNSEWVGSRLFSTSGSSSGGSMYLAAIALYNISLSNDQHVQIVERMNSL